MTKKSEPARTSTENDDDEMEDAVEHLLALEALEDEAEPTEEEGARADALVARTRAEAEVMMPNANQPVPRPKE